MKKFLIVFITFIWSSTMVCQSIQSYWLNIHKLHNYYECKRDQVKSITVDKTGYYASGGSYHEKWIYNFINLYTIQGVLYKDDKLSSKFTYELDSLGRMIKKVVASNLPAIGWQKSTYIYEYSGQNKIKEKHLDADSKLIQVVKYKYDSLNNPIYLSFGRTGNQISSYATAKYDYQNYTYDYKAFDANNQLVLQEEKNFNKDTTSNIRNEHGDLTKFIWTATSPDKEVYHLLEYKYDERGNWIRRKRMIQTKKGKSKSSIVKRKFEYID